MTLAKEKISLRGYKMQQIFNNLINQTTWKLKISPWQNTEL